MTSSKGMRKAIVAVVGSVALAVAGTMTAGAWTSGATTGIDIANHQHPGGAPINWGEVKSDDQSFAFVKATEGSDWTNPHFITDSNAAAASGLKVGAYHYARPASSATRQAAHFAAQLALVPNQTLPPVLDIEVDEGLSSAQLEQWIRDFTTELRTLTGRTPMIYTYKYFWMGQMGNTTEFSDMPLWLAAYQDEAPDPVGGWNKISFWQRSGSGRVNGITGPVDMNVFNGNEGQLDSFSNGNYLDIGGILEGLVLGDDAPDLSSNSAPLIGAILALAAGIIASPQLIDAAQQAGLDGNSASVFTDFVKQLTKNGSLPIEDLVGMASGDFTVGDLAILLDNAGHVATANGANPNQVEQAQDAVNQLAQ
ncbi:glycoside hydrolase family 25 protein [Corynebacterium sp. c25Ua_89]|uniref:glycoside hydrolase family 25 protein n=1 Tax=Corynebacterium sp. c25Ua_89 TaxID=3032356 RepID=UPI0039C41B01